METNIETTVTVKTKKAKVKKGLNKETKKVLGVIVKNVGLTATKIQKKLRWAFIPTRALGLLRTNKFVLVNKKDKTYTVSAAGQIAFDTKPVKAGKKVKTPKTAPVVAAEAGVGPADIAAGEPAADLALGVVEGMPA